MYRINWFGLCVHNIRTKSRWGKHSAFSCPRPPLPLFPPPPLPCCHAHSAENNSWPARCSADLGEEPGKWNRRSSLKQAKWQSDSISLLPGRTHGLVRERFKSWTGSTTSWVWMMLPFQHRLSPPSMGIGKLVFLFSLLSCHLSPEVAWNCQQEEVRKCSAEEQAWGAGTAICHGSGKGWGRQPFSVSACHSLRPPPSPNSRSSSQLEDVGPRKIPWPWSGTSVTTDMSPKGKVTSEGHWIQDDRDKASPWVFWVPPWALVLLIAVSLFP